MKLIIMVCVVLVLFTSCQLGPFGWNPLDYEYLEEPLDQSWELTASFEYQHEYGDEDYYKSPREFERDGGGDCEDFCAYLMYLLGENSSMVKIYIKQYDCYHTIVKYNGLYIEAQIYGKYYAADSLTIYNEKEWHTVMNIATNNGTK